ncbi:hypothetical protein CJF30_00000381 [Rutstroemia sp. NJR-2017a BBW]|nr:hypothetical protein CJF30_00000381 [Rutstroemia sp. NJR-2017a BBW]
MCYLVVERYSVCRCLYYQHSVDMCAAYGTQGHGIQERTPPVKHTVFGNWMFMAIATSCALRI